jgi:hypothetical protein
MAINIAKAPKLLKGLLFTRLRRQHDFRFPLAVFMELAYGKDLKGAGYQDLRWFPELLLSLAGCQS